jgi:GNAT superfamily N-acetyltransferase
MTKPAIKTATAADQAAAVAVVTLGFSADPIARWSWPDPAVYLEAFPRFVRAFAGKAFAHGSAYYADGYAGAALWLPPDVHPDNEALGALMESTTPAAIRGDVFAMVAQMETYHPHEPHWFLPLVGVDPAQQGKGYGGALMRHALERCDREGRLAYLDATSPRNRALYERHGFEPLGTVQVGSSPPITPMLRRPRRAASTS